ncbi:MAG: hypothetical protein LQ348_000836 [Seirophora lacunosa]|nr:MAG: hypothetical protein LQ348_000836 [Seirophora lacunosa]
MADVLPYWLGSLDPYHPAITQSMTSTSGSSIITTNGENQHDMVKGHGHAHAGITKTKKPTTTVKLVNGKNTRPLNSFIGFRCYYSVLFEDLEQKIISSYIVFLWERDPCKAKWALAAKAYSIIRDQVGKQNAPLDTFLMHVANFLGIVEPQKYLAVMGWEISVDGIGTMSLVKKHAMEIDSNILSTNLSVEDIINFAFQQGFAGAMDPMIATPSNKPVMAMAAAAQPLSAKLLEKNGNDDEVQSKGTAAKGRAQGSSEIKKKGATAGTQQLTSHLPSTQNTAATINPAPAASVSVPIATASVSVPIAATPNTYYSTEPLHINNILEFDPDAGLSIWDPLDGDTWDTFDISAWIHEDAYIS